MRSSAPLIAAAAIAVGLAACLGNTTCPAGTTQLGNYTVTYTQLDEGDTCVVSVLPDGGATDSLLVTTPGASSMLLCASGADGGPVNLYLTNTELGAPDASTYLATGSQTDVSNTACLCPIDINDTLSITLATADGGPFAFDADGGFDNIPTFTGHIDDTFLHTPGDSSVCGCNVPCGVHYTLSATQ